MTVVVRLFAGLRERAGWSERELEARRVGDVWPALGLGDEPEGLLYAVNREYADRDRALSDGDEVALIPPVSGGAFRITEEPLSLERVVAEVADERAGGIATFTGTVRRQSRGREVTHLEYEAYVEMAEDVMAKLAADLESRYDLCAVAIHHRVGRVEIGEASVVIAIFTGTVRRESRGRAVLYLEYEAYAEMAEDVMAQIAARLRERHEVSAISIHHRVGRVEIGEPSVVIAVSAPHRGDALAACKDAIDTLKETVPLWKKEVYEGGEEWIGRGS